MDVMNQEKARRSPLCHDACFISPKRNIFRLFKAKATSVPDCNGTEGGIMELNYTSVLISAHLTPFSFSEDLNINTQSYFRFFLFF